MIHATTEEELHSALEECEFDGEIDHPLLQELDFTPARAIYCNFHYLTKLQQIYEAVRIGHWGSYVGLHEKPYRLDAFTQIKDCIRSDKARWALLSETWIASENIRQNRAKWRRLWNSDWPNKLHAMNAKERRAYAALPDQLIIYRGVGKGRNAENGLSWTLVRDTAVYFATRHGGQGLLFTARAKKSDVHALLLGRKEQEVVIDKVKITERRRVLKHRS
jgi:hypothetical protein